MRGFIDLVESILTETIDTLTADETKFWYSTRENRFVDHDIDTHHTKILATNPEEFDLKPDEVAHHPHASGEYGDQSWDDDEGSFDGEEFADNDDMGLFAAAFDRGWVRGGHFIDVMSYHEFGQVNHDGGIYLQGSATRDLQKCVRACVKRWPDIDYFYIETDQSSHVEIRGWEEIDQYIKTGRKPMMEKVFDEMEAPYGRNPTTPIYINPSRAEFLALMEKLTIDYRTDPNGTMRGLLDPKTNDIYIWDGYTRTHGGVMDAYGLGGSFHLILTEDTVRALTFWRYERNGFTLEDVQGLIEHNAVLKRCYRNNMKVKVDP